MSDRRQPAPLSEDVWMHALGVDDRALADGSIADEYATIDDVLAAELLLGEMAFASLATPPPSLRDRLLAQVAAEASVKAPTVPFVLRSDETEWVETGIPGVRRRNLFLDEGTQRASFLVQMDPGAQYPPHRHVGVEECFVLAGTVRDDESTVSAGDYVRYECSTDHTSLRTDTGCTILLIGPATNQRLA